MLKKILLSTLVTVSTVATAQINLDLNLAIKNDDIQHNIPGNIVVDEEVTLPIEFSGLDQLVLALFAKRDGETVIFNTQFFQKTENGEFDAATEIFTVQTTFGEVATIVVNDTQNENSSLTLTMTPTQIEE